MESGGSVDGFRRNRRANLSLRGTAQFGIGAAGGGMLAFALSFDEIIVTTFTAGHERTLPLWLLNQLGRPRDVPVTNVVALLVMLVTMFPILGAWWLTRDGDISAENGK